MKISMYSLLLNCVCTSCVTYMVTYIGCPTAYVTLIKHCTIDNVMSPGTLGSNSSAKNVIQLQKSIVRQRLMYVMILFQLLWHKYNVSVSYISL